MRTKREGATASRTKSMMEGRKEKEATSCDTVFVVLGFSIFLDRDRTEGRGAGRRERSKESKRQTNGWVARASDTYRAHDGYKGGL